MKISSGRATALWLLLVCLAAVTPASLARVTAEVDRSDMAMGETLRLTLTADSGERPDEIDLVGLERDFEILQRSSATSARIINGEQSVSRTLELELAPRREGLMTIPAFDYGGLRTTPIAIKVAPAPDIALDDELVYFDAKIDRDEVYVQAQLLLTITLQQAINLDNRAVSELDIPNTYVESLEQKSYQRRAAGRLWQVTELRYALFPQQSGPLTIPELSFSGRELLPGRSLLGARLGRRIALTSSAIEVNVKPVPAGFPGKVWLPARRLELESQWSASPDRLSVGDSSTRSIAITAEGLQGAQLPPINSLDESGVVSGLKFYPDQETIEQQELPIGIEGFRVQSEALVATEAGSWTLPELAVPWWNTETDALEYARIPAVDVVIGGAATPTKTAGLDPVGGAGTVGTTALIPGPLLLYQGLAAAGWALALVLLVLRLRTRPTATPRRVGEIPPRVSNRELLPLRLACSKNDPQAARAALIDWGQAWLASPRPPSLASLEAAVETPLAEEISALDDALWGNHDGNWSGSSLFAKVKDQGDRPASADSEGLTLYPGEGSERI